MTCLCKICGATFDANPLWHHPTGVCGEECRKQARRINKAKYKKTDKGRATRDRWVKSEAFKKNEYLYRQNPTAQKRAAERQRQYLRNSISLRQSKKIRDNLRRKAPGRFTREELVLRFDMYGNRCQHCGTTENLTIDHIIPLKLGGTHFIDNIQPLCKSCNPRKGARYVG